MKLTDLKRSKEEKKIANKQVNMWDDADYPWGLQLRLDDATIKKMGLGDLDADQKVRIEAEAFVAEDSVNKRNDKTVRSIELQITKIALTQSESDEVLAKTMYN